MDFAKTVLGTVAGVLSAGVLCMAALSGALAGFEGADRIAAIHGRVYDLFGRPLHDAVVEVSVPDHRDRFRGVTDGGGSYRIAGIPPSRVSVSVKLPGFETATRAASLWAGADLLLDVGLPLGKLPGGAYIVLHVCGSLGTLGRRTPNLAST